MRAVKAPVVEFFLAEELGNSSFLIADADAGEAVVIDPLRDIDQYLSKAEEMDVRLTRSLDTHTHNDFVSGGRELQAEVGARRDPPAAGDVVAVGRWRLQARPTPGHTPDHLSYLLLDEDGRPAALFSGGALMVGSVARTDLFGPHLAVQLAHEAFKTLHQRLRDLPDQLAVYPTHGGGSFCGTGGGAQRSSTLGEERRTNPYFQASELLPFLARILQQNAYPDYYRLMAGLNSAGASLNGRELSPPPHLPAEEVARRLAAGTALIDVREPREYDRGHVPGSYSISLDGNPFSAWVGWIIKADRPLILIGGTELERRQAARQLFRIGYDSVVGQADLDEWEASGRALSSFEAAEVGDLQAWLLAARPMTLVDVRDEHEWVDGHVPGSVHIPVPSLARDAGQVRSDVPVAVHCASGFRAGIAASLLEQAGLRDIIHVHGGYSDWVERGLPVSRP
jgi:hydroxyacylglutathione hydrolase